MKARIVYALVLSLATSLASAVEGDPQPSVMWDYFHTRLLDSGDFVFDDKVQVRVDRKSVCRERV